jgi:RNA polymerase sigma-70 factor (ECF subfamily)
MNSSARERARNDFSKARDEALVAMTCQGNERAFAELVRRNIPMAHTLAKSVVGSPDEADDICQEAFLAALRSIEQCRRPDRFRSWLQSIVRNRALNHLASESRRATVSMDVVGECAGLEDPSIDLERKELRFKLYGMAQTLSATQERVFRLRDVEGWNYGEISEELGISHGACRVHLHMARKRLRAGLAEPRLGIA